MFLKLKKLPLPQQLGLGSFVFILAIFIALILIISDLLNTKINEIITIHQEKEAEIVSNQLYDKYQTLNKTLTRQGNALDKQLQDSIIDTSDTVEMHGVELPSIKVNYEAINGNSDYMIDFASIVEMEVNLLYQKDGHVYRTAGSNERLPFEVNANNPALPSLTDLQNKSDFAGKIHINKDSYFALYKKVSNRDHLFIELLIPYNTILAPLIESIGKVTFGKEGYIFVADNGANKGDIIIHPSLSGINLYEKKSPLAAILDKMYAGKEGILYYETKIQGKDSAPRQSKAIYTTVPGWDWLLVLKTYKDEYQEDVNYIIYFIASIASAATIILSLVLWIFIRRALSPLNKISHALNQLGSGNLTFEFSTPSIPGSRNEMDRLQVDTLKMRDSLIGLINNVLTSSQQLLGSAQSITRSNSDLRSSANDSHETSLQVSSAIAQISASIEEMAQNANEVSKESISVSEATEDGNQSVKQVEQTISNLSSTFADTATTIETLESSSKGIGKVVNVINDIAEQTNLLALNAAIEAARAGEQGRGFAVVADEVRVLAQRTQKSTEEIQKVVAELQTNSRSAVEKMNQGRDQVEKSVEQAITAGTLLDRIYRSIQTVEASINGVAAMTEQQSVAAAQIRQNMENLKNVATDTLNQADVSQEHSDQIQALAQNLQTQLSAFKMT